MELNEIMLVNAEKLYELYQTNEKNDLPDLTIGMAFYREQHPELTQEEDDAMIGFISRHTRELARAYPDRAAFYQAWAEGVAEDIQHVLEQAQEVQEDQEEPEAEG